PLQPDRESQLAEGQTVYGGIVKLIASDEGRKPRQGRIDNGSQQVRVPKGSHVRQLRDPPGVAQQAADTERIARGPFSSSADGGQIGDLGLKALTRLQSQLSGRGLK